MSQLPFNKDFGLGLFTDLRINSDQVVVDELDTNVLIRSLDAPLYFYGNMIWTHQPPEQQYIDKAESVFNQHLPDAVHRTVAWHGEQVVDKQAWLDADYTLHQTTTLSRADVPELLTCEYLIKPINSEPDWQQWLDMEVNEYAGAYGESYRQYATTRMKRYQALAKQGEYLAAFDGNKLVASLGLYCFDGIARFQSVLTHPDYRGQGIASALLCQALNRCQYEQAVIVAESESAAERLYRKNGFLPCERESAWMKY